MKRIVQFLRTAGRLKNYVTERIRYLTFKKIINIAKVEWALLKGRTSVSVYPYEIVIDPTNICQLNCPLCPTGSRNSKRPKGHMDFDLFKRIVDEVGKHALHIYLHNWGESLLHRNVIDFIHYAKSYNLAVSLSTNLNFTLTERRIDDILTSGLDTLVISLDGTNSETYEKYRVGGDFAVVLDNMKWLVSRKKALGLKRPFIEWQFLVMRHNEHEVQKATLMAREIAIDNIAFGTIVLPFGMNDYDIAANWFSERELKTRSRYDIQERDIGKKCWWLWRGVVFNWDGTIYPCCYVDEESAIFGNIKESPFMDIWNGPSFIEARKLFSGKNAAGSVICSRCGIVISHKQSD